MGRFEISRGGVTSVAFRYNLESRHTCDGLPDEYATCDVLYGDPPWPAGYAEFNRRGGVTDPKGYSYFAKMVDTLMALSGRPGVLIAGRSFLASTGSARVARETRRTTLNGEPALAILYGGLSLPNTGSSEDVLIYLARHFRRVGDFMCGYGRAGRVFAADGGSFVLSDCNASCVGYVASHAAEWFPGEGK